jgi:hypothetical protein
MFFAHISGRNLCRESLACLAVLAFLAGTLPSLAGAQQPPVHGAQTFVLGSSAVPLTGPWKFHPGDDLAWAQSEFDDSGWGTLDLTPAEGSADPFSADGGYAPGWTSRGYPTLSGYAWYRLRVILQPGQAIPASALGIKMPADFEDAYQLYVNGQLAGQFGNFGPHVKTFLSLPRSFPLPPQVDTSRPIELALRLYMNPLFGGRCRRDARTARAWNKLRR